MFFVGGALQALQAAAGNAGGGFQGTDWGTRVGTSGMTGTPQVAPGTRGYGWKYMGNGQYADPGPARPTTRHGENGAAGMAPFVAGMQTAAPVAANYNQGAAMGAKPGDTPRSNRTSMSALGRVAGRGFSGVAPKKRGGGYR